ncbi:hypothetical protein K7X08_007923 [Anisodus acutangulus]|uniref:O-fucosyltransferase family protein n=1 Tax=Anisodus acutangulus TaxID=402998 RepID=A0A9Q1MPD6_9SOLA|nr:hypothetical protein K7X08_007923 [Anisodus acutangulus]
MESVVQVRSEKVQNLQQGPVILRTRLKVWFITICAIILIWTGVVQLWHLRLLSGFTRLTKLSVCVDETMQSLPPLLPPRNYTSNGFLQVSCNGGLTQMRAAICDMVTVARLLNLTLVVPQLDKSSFWADPSDFEDIFDVRHFIDSLRDEVLIIKRLPKKFGRRYGYHPLVMPPVSWSSDMYYLQQILPLFSKHKVINFNRTDTRLANNGIPLELQNFHALKFTPKIEALGRKLVHILQQRVPYPYLVEVGRLFPKGPRLKERITTLLNMSIYAFPWWKEKEIVSDEKRSQGLCPLTPEEAALVLQALSIEKDMQIYIASGDIYGSEQRLTALRTAFPKIVKKEMLLDPEELQQFQNHTSQMAALDFIVSTASNIFIPSYDGNMAKLVEGHRRYRGYKKTIQLDRKTLVRLLDLLQNRTLSWDESSAAVQQSHEERIGQPARQRVIEDKPKEEDYFYANPHECLV